MGEREGRVLVVGSVTIDDIVAIPRESIERISLHNGETSFLLLEQGRKVEAESMSSHVGGGAANVAVAMSRLGFQADVLALAGDDINGRAIRQHLNEEGVGTSHLLTHPEWQTGHSVLVYAHDKNAAIFTKRGINDGLGEHLETVDFSAYQLVYVGCLGGRSREAFPQLVERAKAAGCLVAANPCIGEEPEDIDRFLAVAEQLDYLSLNKQETAELLSQTHRRLNTKLPLLLTDIQNRPPLLESGLHVSDYWLPLNDVMSMICSAGPSCFSLTDGSDGAYLFYDRQLLYCPPARVEAMGTAGAGDAFAATVVAQLLRGCTPTTALFAASRNAASVVGYMDTQSGLLRAAEMDNLIARNDPDQCVTTLGTTATADNNPAF